jgi:hypothetical protein
MFTLTINFKYKYLKIARCRKRTTDLDVASLKGKECALLGRKLHDGGLCSWADGR